MKQAQQCLRAQVVEASPGSVALADEEDARPRGHRGRAQLLDRGAVHCRMRPEVVGANCAAECVSCGNQTQAPALQSPELASPGPKSDLPAQSQVAAP